MILGLGYRARVGKDIAAAYLARRYGFVRFSVGDFIKAEVRRMLQAVGEEFSEENKPSFRPLLSFWGNYRRKKDEFYWLNGVKRIYAENTKANYVLADVRYPLEADWVKSAAGFLIRIDREEGLKIPEEEALRDYSFDFVIENNDSLEEFYRKIDQVLISTKIF